MNYKVGRKNTKSTKKDWKLYRERIGDWQEAYMEKLVQKYVEYLQENLPESDEFWKLEKRIKNDKKKPGVLIELQKSSMRAQTHPSGSLPLPCQYQALFSQRA